MTSETKIDPQLAEWMQRQPAEPIPVLIEMADQPAPERSIDRAAEMRDLDNRSAETQADVREDLRRQGIDDAEIETFALVNALAVRLLPDQIRRMAERKDVRFLRYNGQAHVAL